MLIPTKKSGPGWSLVVLAAVLSTSPAGAADPRITRARAEVAATKAGAGALPLEVDDALVAALDQATATPENRAKLQQSLVRMQAHRAMLQEVLKTRGLPVELAAVALMESGFDNDAHPGSDLSRGAGIWQLIPSTARANGLRVEGATDERLDPRRSTEGAAALLASLYRRYGDWSVAITAYGRGTTAVDKIVADAGVRDGRVLQRKGLLGRYLTRVQLGVLLLRDPALLD